MKHQYPILTVDVVLLTLKEGRLQVALALRQDEEVEYQKWCLPGAYVHTDEDTDAMATAHRLLQQKVAITVRYMEQLQTFSGNLRDPRGWSASIAYLALIPHQELEQRNPDYQFFPVDELDHLALGFDHRDIIRVALERLRNKTSYSTLPFALLPEKFTFPELQKTYEQVLGCVMKGKRANFSRKIEELGVLHETGEFRKPKGAGAPAMVYTIDRLAVFNKGF